GSSTNRRLRSVRTSAAAACAAAASSPSLASSCARSDMRGNRVAREHRERTGHLAAGAASFPPMEFPAWDPVLLEIPGLPIAIRWYGLMYVVGFLCAQWIFVRLARRGFFPVPPAQAPDLILYAVLGVMLGGRLGYALWYDRPAHELLLPWNFV